MAFTLTLIHKDHKQDNEGGWHTIGMFGFTGELPCIDPATYDETAILNAAFDLGFPTVSHGNGGAGQAYARQPFIQYFETSIVIEQSGGLDI